MTTTFSRVFEDPLPTKLFYLAEEDTAESGVAPAPLTRACPGLLSTRQRLLDHPIYDRVVTIRKLRKFMEDHVFAVWDFMSLTKRLQQELTCVCLPWQMPEDAVMARFINEIVLGEESDEGLDGIPMSHLALYLAAMEEIGADTRIFMKFNSLLASGETPQAALVKAGVPDYVQTFVLNTLDVAQHGKTIEVIAAFLYGREDVIPHMFKRLLYRWQGRYRLIPHFAYYLERHIELDGDDHGPAARRLLERYAQADSALWHAAGQAAMRAIESRIELWDKVLQAIARPGREQGEEPPLPMSRSLKL